jgi:hypothetical protein
MSGDVGFDRRPKAPAAARVFLGLWAVPTALLMASSIVAAQENQNSAASSSTTTTLPEIHVIATTPVPVAPPSRPIPAAAGANTAASSNVTGTQTASQPGVVDQDKIPSNVQTVGASAFDGMKAPDLLQSMLRALPGVSLSSQTGNESQLDLNYRGFIASPVIGTPQGLAVYQNGVRINSATSSIGISSRREQSTN